MGDSLKKNLKTSLRWHYPDQVKGSEQEQFFLSRVTPAPLGTIHFPYHSTLKHLFQP